jgi:hypothetical protein
MFTSLWAGTNVDVADAVTQRRTSTSRSCSSCTARSASTMAWLLGQQPKGHSFSTGSSCRVRAVTQGSGAAGPVCTGAVAGACTSHSTALLLLLHGSRQPHQTEHIAMRAAAACAATSNPTHPRCQLPRVPPQLVVLLLCACLQTQRRNRSCRCF